MFVTDIEYETSYKVCNEGPPLTMIEIETLLCQYLKLSLKKCQFPRLDCLSLERVLLLYSQEEDIQRKKCLVVVLLLTLK